MKDRCHIDIETYSEVNLKESGVYVYAEHESTEILCVCYSFGDGPVKIWVPLYGPSISELLALITSKTKHFTQYGGTCPSDLRDWIIARKEVAAHNAQFERTLINGQAGRRLGIPRLEINQMICTAAKARTYGLPGRLGDATAALGTYPKDETGRGIMLQLCRPRSGKVKRYSIEENIDDYVHLYNYCADDVRAEQGLDSAIPDISTEELEVWRLDQRINDLGVGVDLERIADVQFLITAYKAELEQQCIELTKSICTLKDGKVIYGAKPTQRAKIADWVRAQGYVMFDMTADTVNHAVEDPECPELVKTVLRIYSTYGMKAVSKFDAIEAAVSSSNRIRGMMMYYGAGTGRWSSLIVQLQNLYRPKIKDPNTAIEAYSMRDLEWVRFLYPGLDPMKVFASTVRGMLVPAAGYDLAVLDYAGIESRKIAWLYDEEWKLDAFRARDADPDSNPDNYQLAYGRIFGVDPAGVTGFDRQVGKVIELALGYEGGVGAFVTMAPTYNVDLLELADRAYEALPEWALESAEWMWTNIECKRGNPTGLAERVYTTIDAIKHGWRAEHPAIKQGWKDTLDAAKLAVANKGKIYAIPNKKLMFQVKDRWLYMRLPSGRSLKYFEPELHDVNGNVAGSSDSDLSHVHLTYMGIDSRTRRWSREGTYGGKLAENAVQASSNCLLRKAMLRLDKAGYTPILSVHDEVVAEIPEGWGSLEEMSKIMCQPEPWCAGLPITAEGYRAKRYRKG